VRQRQDLALAIALAQHGHGASLQIQVLQAEAGQLAPAQGQVEQQVDDGAVRSAVHVAYLDQDPRYYAWMTGAELLRFAGELRGLRGTELAGATKRAAVLAGIEPFMRRRIGGYSGGMRQRLGIAQAAIGDPEVLLLDEPVSFLDPEGRHKVLEVVSRLRGTATVLLSTHIIGDVECVCDRVAILDAGRLVAESDIASLLERHATPVYEVELRDADGPLRDALAGRIAARPWASAVGWHGETLPVRASDAAQAARRLVVELAAAGACVDRLERLRPSLEDVFLSLVGEAKP
jgi:ABC-2 type transport system ATP-binding protein